MRNELVERLFIGVMSVMRSSVPQFDYGDKERVYGADESCRVPISQMRRWRVNDALEVDQVHDGLIEVSLNKNDWELRLYFTREDDLIVVFLKWPGDIICIHFGGAIAFILRPFGKGPGYYEYIGGCYHDNCMEG